MPEQKLQYSVVIPVRNEAGAIFNVLQELRQVMDSLRCSYEILVVDDGSSDNTVEEVKRFSPVTIVRFRKNFGQTAALDAGIKVATGEVVITLDGDGQNPPSSIPALLAELQQGYDVVSGWRYDRHDSWMKRLVSRGANFLRHLLINDQIHDSGCTLKVYRRDCFEDVDLYGEMHRFIPAVLKLQGFKIGEVKVEHRPRVFGVTKYNWKRLIKGFLDMWSVWFWRKYANRPLHLFGGLGLLFLFFGSSMGCVLITLRLLNIISLQNTILPLASIFFVFAGIQLFVSGIMADMLVKNYYRTGQKAYKIKEIIVN